MNRTVTVYTCTADPAADAGAIGWFVTIPVVVRPFHAGFGVIPPVTAATVALVTVTGEPNRN
ncbi:hypothetical protein, partial [Desertimonas flava]|uniref:hypothetical protein n=1 Tax=Desertimonas flava TaxID=2064846 RepID=UPI001969900A